MIRWHVALVCSLCLYGLDGGHHSTPNHDDFQCYKCDEEHVFPHCEIQMCRHDEFCWMSNDIWTPESKCVPHHECHHDMIDATCSLGSIFKCEKCCADEPCVNIHFGQILLAHSFTLKPFTVAQTQPTSTSTPKLTTTQTTTTTTTTTPNTGSHPFLQGKCADELVGHICMDTREMSCKNHEGLSLCAETCGLCGLLRERFGNNGTCRDQAVADECRTHTNICSTVMAEIACPVTCNLCDTVLTTFLDKVSKMKHSSMVNAAVSSASTPVATTAATTAATTTMEPCFDNHDNCAALNDPCNNVLAGQICRKFCNLCSDGVINPGIIMG